MNRFFALLLAASCLTAVGQVTYPYNPDGNADGEIAVGDLQDFLVTYGNPFSPSEIMVGDTALSDWIYLLDSSLTSLQSEVSPVVFGERQLIQVDSLQWTEIQSPNRLVTELAFGQDGLLILGTNCYGSSRPVEVFVHPEGIVPCGQSIFDCGDVQINSFFESGQFLDYQFSSLGLTVAVRASEKVALRLDNSSDDCVDQTIWWIPFDSSPSQQHTSTDTLSTEFTRGEDFFVNGSPRVLEVVYDSEIPELWSLRGQLNGSWTTVERVPTDSIIFVASTFENLDVLKADFQDAMRIRLDDCDSRQIAIQFNRVFDWQPSVSLADSLRLQIEDAFEIDLQATPTLVVETPQGAQLLVRQMYSFGYIFDGNNDNGWSDFGQYGLAGGEEFGRSTLIRLGDGNWVPK